MEASESATVAHIRVLGEASQLIDRVLWDDLIAKKLVKLSSPHMLVDKQLSKFQTAGVRLTVTCLLAYTLLLPTNRAQTPAEVPIFKISQDKSTIKFAVKASVPIEGDFQKWDATFTFASAAVESGVLDIKIQSASVNTGSGMKDGKLKSKDFFDAEQDPYIAFHSTKIVETGPNTVDIPGKFTIRGVTKDETLHLTGSGKGTGHGEITGTMAFDRKDYGMNSGIPFIKIADRVEVTVYLIVDRVSGPPLVFKQ
jgi:polyisoprenoid-binding protein YceI